MLTVLMWIGLQIASPMGSNRVQGEMDRLLGNLRSDQARIRAEAMKQLVVDHFREPDRVAPVAAEFLTARDPNADVRYFAAVYLAKSSYAVPPAERTLDRFLPALEAALHDPDQRVREWGAFAAALVQPSPPTMLIDDLVRLLEDTAWKTRERAAIALSKVTPLKREVLQPLLDLVSAEDNDRVVGNVLQALGGRAEAFSSSDASRFVEVLILHLYSQNKVVQQRAMTALGQLESRAVTAVEHLEAIMADPQATEEIKNYASRALKQIQK